MLCGEALSPGVCPALRLFVAFADASASVKMEKMALAELPQASKWEKWPLRNFRKHQNGENGLCGTSASIKMEEMALAELPQASKWGKWPLRNFRKRQKVLRGTCGTSANTKKFLERLAGLSQAFPKVIFPLVCSIFGHSARIGTKKSRACDVESQALLCLSAKNRRTGGAVRGLHVIYSTISTIGAPT